MVVNPSHPPHPIYAGGCCSQLMSAPTCRCGTHWTGLHTCTLTAPREAPPQESRPRETQYPRARAKPPTTKWPRSGKKVKCPVCEQAGYPDPRPNPGNWANAHLQWHLKCPTCGRYVHARGWWQHNWMHPLPTDFIQALKDLPVIKATDQ